MDVIEAFSDKPIAFHASLSKKLKIGAIASLFLCQALYWTKVKEKVGESWFYKSAVDWEEETSLTQQEQRTARKKLKELGILEEAVKGIPPTVYYKINKDQLRKLLSNESNDVQQINCPDSTNQFVGSNKSIVEIQQIDSSNSTNLYKEHRLHTEITTQNTTEKKIYKKDLSSDVISIFEHWKQTLQHPNSVLDDKRKKKIKERLAEGYTVEQLKNVINGCKCSAYHMGHNEGGKIYDSIDLLFRDAEHVDRFISYFEKPPIPKTKGTLESERFHMEFYGVQESQNIGKGDTFRH
jgi:hypothetical protein